MQAACLIFALLTSFGVSFFLKVGKVNRKVLGSRSRENIGLGASHLERRLYFLK